MNMRKICAGLLAVLLLCFCACWRQAKPEKTIAPTTITASAVATTTEARITTERALQPQRISSPNPFFDGMETERWVEGMSWRYLEYKDETGPMILRTTKVREENGSPVYEIVLEFLFSDADKMATESLGFFLVREDQIIRYPADKTGNDGVVSVVCQSKDWNGDQFDVSEDGGSNRVYHSITAKGEIAEYRYFESYTHGGAPNDWKYGLSLKFRWEKRKGLIGYYTGVKEGAMITAFGDGWDGEL